ncbi:MAG: DEAD/DEAH box helicase [Acidimicrobiales bacterium]
MPTTFADVGVPADLVALLAQRGITLPFAIQSAALADALAGRDVSGKAPTGSGKTLAFGIPLAVRVGAAKARKPRALVLVPTRELAAQVANEVRPLAGVRGRTVAAFYGGTGYGPQRKALASGVEIIVACPGRLEDLLQNGDLSLAEVDIVVVDEADRMADMGFLPAVRRILDQVSPQRQTMLFSATLDGDINDLVRRYQRNPVRHELVEPEGASGDVEHLFWKVGRDQRIGLTASLVQREWPAIVFCRTRHGADRLARQLATAGVASAAIHGNRTQGQRERALAAFTSGAVQALVATDVAARGIHVDAVACVVHFDPPADEKDYVHRSGRTGRAGADGLVVSMVAPEVSGAVRSLQRALGKDQRLTEPDLDGRPIVAPPVVRPTPRPERRDLPASARNAKHRGRPQGPAASRDGQRRGVGQGRPQGSGGAPGGRRNGPSPAGGRRSARPR